MDYGYHKDVPETDERQPRWKQQREERGWDDTELWNLDYTMAKFIAPRLKRFKETLGSHPHDLTFEEWEAKIQKMIDAFEEYQLRDEKMSTWDSEKVDEGLKLFAEYYGHLWN